MIQNISNKERNFILKVQCTVLGVTASFRGVLWQFYCQRSTESYKHYSAACFNCLSQVTVHQVYGDIVDTAETDCVENF